MVSRESVCLRDVLAASWLGHEQKHPWEKALELVGVHKTSCTHFTVSMASRCLAGGPPASGCQLSLPHCSFRLSYTYVCRSSVGLHPSSEGRHSGCCIHPHICIPVTQVWMEACCLRAISSAATHRPALLSESHWNVKGRAASRTSEPYEAQLFLGKENIFVIDPKQKDRDTGQRVRKQKRQQSRGSQSTWIGWEQFTVGQERFLLCSATHRTTESSNYRRKRSLRK